MMAEGKRQKAEGVPEGWQKQTLERVSYIQTGLAKGKTGLKSPVKRPFLRVANVQDARFELSDIHEIELEESQVERFALKFGDVVITEGGDADKLGRGHIWRNEIPICVHQNHLFAIRANGELLNPEYLSFLISSKYGKSYFLSCAKQSTNLASINSTQLKAFPLLLPPLPEQKKIAAILSTWDDSLATLAQLIAAKRQQKRGLAEALLTGKKRLKGFAGEWEEKKLGEVLFEPKQDAEKEPHKIELLTVKLHVKGIEKSGKFPAKTKAARPYYKRFEGEILIGRQNFHNGGVGIVKPEQSGLIASNAISSYIVKGDDLEFVFYSISREIFYSAVDDLIGGTGQKEISRSEFARLRIPVPPLPEQQAIASILSTLDGEIASLEALKAKVQEQKRGLMDELLTGRVRVKVEKEC